MPVLDIPLTGEEERVLRGQLLQAQAELQLRDALLREGKYFEEAKTALRQSFMEDLKWEIEDKSWDIRAALHPHGGRGPAAAAV